MKTIYQILLVSTLLVLTLGCEPKKVEKNVWDEQTKALEKAREVEDKLMQKADDMQRELENIDAEDPPNR